MGNFHRNQTLNLPFMGKKKKIRIMLCVLTHLESIDPIKSHAQTLKF